MDPHQRRRSRHASLPEKEADPGVRRLRSEEYHRMVQAPNGSRPTGFSNQRRVKGSSGHKWRSKAPHIRPKERRGATKATSVAVPKIARTARERRLATRRARPDT